MTAMGDADHRGQEGGDRAGGSGDRAGGADGDGFVWATDRRVSAESLRSALPTVARIESAGPGAVDSLHGVDVCRPLLLCEKRCSAKVLASNVFWNESRRQYVAVGPQLVVPVSSQGESASWVGPRHGHMVLGRRGGPAGWDHDTVTWSWVGVEGRLSGTTARSHGPG